MSCVKNAVTVVSLIRVGAVFVPRLSEDFVVKIADFGLARDIDESSYYVISSEWKLPVRWMAPESLTVHKFSVMSDVVGT